MFLLESNRFGYIRLVLNKSWKSEFKIRFLIDSDFNFKKFKSRKKNQLRKNIIK